MSFRGIEVETDGSPNNNPVSANLLYAKQSQNGSDSQDHTTNHKRRVSLCDISSLNQELASIQNPSEPPPGDKSTPRDSSDSSARDSNSPSGCKNHQRRRSVALKFDSPRVI